MSAPVETIRAYVLANLPHIWVRTKIGPAPLSHLPLAALPAAEVERWIEHWELEGRRPLAKRPGPLAEAAELRTSSVAPRGRASSRPKSGGQRSGSLLANWCWRERVPTPALPEVRSYVRMLLSRGVPKHAALAAASRVFLLFTAGVRWNVGKGKQLFDQVNDHALAQVPSRGGNLP